MNKYFKPKSLTWWSALFPLLAGVFLALEPLHGMTEAVQAINAMTGGLEPVVLINLGLAGIGLRGAFKE